MSKKNQPKHCKLFIKGMHCSSCEILIEKKLLKQPGVKAVDASLNSGTATVYFDSLPELKQINAAFAADGYQFSLKRFPGVKQPPLLNFTGGKLEINPDKLNALLRWAGLSLLILFAFFLVDKSKLAASISVNSSSSLPVFFLFGLVAGSSTCAALIGGLLLSLGKKWNEQYISETSDAAKATPYLLFNLGRLVSFFVLGGVLGTIGRAIQINSSITALLIIVISLAMTILGLQMLEVKWAYRFNFTVPKFLSRKAASTDERQSRFMPLLTGMATFFLPCGFTLVAQGIAVTSGSFMNGALIMGAFALGTLPVLAAISWSNIRFNKRPHFTAQFNKIAGLIVVFFALYNINAQMNVLGVASLSDINFNNPAPVAAENVKLPEIVNNEQILKMSANALGYTPSILTVRAGIPVRWEIEDTGTAGCTTTFVAPGLINGVYTFHRGQNVLAFTAPKAGTYKFSCAMGMVTGRIEAI